MIPFHPIDRYLIRLKMTRPARFHFLHGGVIRGLLSAALRTHELPEGILPFACESGRVRFEAGEPYNIGLTFVGTARGVAEDVFKGLREVGQVLRSTAEPAPTLSGNFEIEEVRQIPPPPWLGSPFPAALEESLTVRFLSPLRVRRPRESQKKGQRYMDSRCFVLEQFLVQLWRRIQNLEEKVGGGLAAESAMPPVIPEAASADARDLLWIDLPVTGSREDDDGAGPYTLGGVLGVVRFHGIGREWLDWLARGSLLHAGEKTAFGFGRYVIPDLPQGDPDPFRPARSIVEQIAVPAVLDAALQRVKENSEAAGTDLVRPDDLQAGETGDIGKLSQELRQGSYRPEPLLGALIPKSSGDGVRPLAIPVARDRVVQRALCDVMAPAIDALLENCSYAYRKGFSRSGAARAIQKAFEEGYRFILDADISSFFDNVDWARLEAKLRALYPWEPGVDLLLGAVKAPVEFGGRTVTRERGLPQGSPVSPLLANLYLDEFDEELLGENLRLVRYADDFVILCKDLESAKKTRDLARDALARLGLSLSAAKTSVRSFDDGLDYLGYLFCRSVVLDKEKSPQRQPDEPTADAIPPGSWLASIPFEKVRDLSRPRARRQHPPSVVELHPRARLPASRWPLYVTRGDTEVEVRAETVVTRTRDEHVEEHPIHALSHVVFCGKVRPTVPLVLRLAQHGIPSFFCRRDGELYAVFAPHAPDWALWRKQGEFVADERPRLDFVREVVRAKLHNFATLAVRFKLDGGADAASEIRRLESDCENKEAIDSLRGVEGRAAAIYFGAMKASLSSEWRFEGRRHSPPPDPINAMLSFGYTVLYNHISAALYAEGLHPRIGIFHEERGAYHALACDLQEEFRHLVDGLVCAMVHRGEAKATDFVESDDGKYPSLMTPELRWRFIKAMEGRLLTSFSPEVGQRVTYAAYIEHQTHQVRELVSRRITQYRPLRSHA